MHINSVTISFACCNDYLYSAISDNNIVLQALINLTSHQWVDEHNLRRILLPNGTRMPAWPPKNKVVQDMKRVVNELGFEVKVYAMDIESCIPATNATNNQSQVLTALLLQDGMRSAWLDPTKIVSTRVQYLVKRGLIQLQDGITLKVQILGDASRIWKSMKMNGTVICVKTLHNDKQVGSPAFSS